MSKEDDMKDHTIPRPRRARRVVLVGALSVLTLGGLGSAFATQAAAATPTRVPPAVSTNSQAESVAEPAGAKDADTLQQGDQTGPDTTGADKAEPAGAKDADTLQQGDQTGPDTTGADKAEPAGASQ